MMCYLTLYYRFWVKKAYGLGKIGLIVKECFVSVVSEANTGGEWIFICKARK